MFSRLTHSATVNRVHTSLQRCPVPLLRVPHPHKANMFTLCYCYRHLRAASTYTPVGGCSWTPLLFEETPSPSVVKGSELRGSLSCSLASRELLGSEGAGESSKCICLHPPPAGSCLLRVSMPDVEFSAWYLLHPSLQGYWLSKSLPIRPGENHIWPPVRLFLH